VDQNDGEGWKSDHRHWLSAHGQKIVRLERVVGADGKELRLYGRYTRVRRAAQARI